MLHEVELNSLDVSNLMWDIQKTCVTNEDIEYLWEIKQVWLVRNKELQERYERKRKLMKSLGRTDEETKDDLLFMAEGFNNVQRICEIGPRCKEKKNNVLGDTQFGIHMNRHYDILTRFMVFKNFQQANYLVILRGMLGRVKKVKPFFTGEYGCIAPTPNYDCHLAENAPDLTSIDISDAIAYNFAYMYEYDEETIIPMNYPSHVLPIAVLRLHRTRNRLDRTVLLNYTRERDLALSKNIQRLKNETKPLKHLPRSAPHKKYVVEGRRSGTRLISDVPIEPPSEKPPEETTKKLEKFRRPSALSGGTGMGYMFFRRPFNKMPTTWQRMFGFRSKRKAKTSHSSKKSKRGRSRSRSRSREPEKRKRSRTRSPKSSSSKSREKNLFELFDSKQNQTSDSSSEDELSKQTTNCAVVDKKPSVSSIDTGCKKTVDHRSSGNHTPTQDERHCNDVDIGVSSIKEHERDTELGLNVRKDSQLSRTYVDQKSRTIGDNGKRSHEYSNSISPERKTSVHGSFHEDKINVASSGTQKRSVSSKDKEKDITYQLIRITLDEPDTPSIYHELRGIRIPSGERKKTVKDPRLLRAMGQVIETPVMAGFGPFLRRIKEEPPEDESYGEKQEKRTKNILPVEFIKTEPENEQTEDDVEKALNELNNAIKAIQNNTSVDKDVVNIKKEPEETESCTDGKARVEAQSEKQTDKEMDKEQKSNTDDFLPRNMGFSSYLPEYNDDFERTARVLTEVFGEKAASPTKKVHMSMSDYFGSSNPNVSLNSTNEGNIEGKLSDINSSCEPTRSVQVPKENAEKKENNSCKTKEHAKIKSSVKLLKSNKQEKKDDKISTTTTTKSKIIKLKKCDIKQSLTSDKQNPDKQKYNSNEEFTEQQSRLRSLKTSRSRSPSASRTRKRQLEVKRKRSRSRSLSRYDRDRGRTRSKSPHFKRNKPEKHFSRSPSIDKSSFRSKQESHNSRERRRSRSVSPFCSRSNSSQDSGTKSTYRLSSKTSKDSKPTRRSLAEEIFERENSPGRLRYLEERKKIDLSRRLLTKAKYYKEEMTRLYNSHTGENLSIPMSFDNMQLRPEDTLNLYDNHRSSYVDLTKEPEVSRISERKQPTTNDEAVVNTTLSKAMTSLLKKIVFRDNSNQDDSAEGRMADMVIELVKDQMSKELKSETMPTSASTAAQSVHPFVPYLKQERSVESLYSPNPWHSMMSSSARNEVSSHLDFPHDILEQRYHDEREDSGTSLSYPSRTSFMQQVPSGFSLPDLHDSPNTTFRGKLLSLKTMKKTRGSTYRGRLSSSRGSFQTRGFRGSYRSRSDGHSGLQTSSYRHSFKDKRSYDKR